ncbi:MAG: multidrug efflux pump subunit AcrB [Planctomycetota bacterium]|jgi:multidrug efflux pump subunit AcrB
MTLPEFALRKKPIVLAAVSLLMLWGCMATMKNSRREDPEFTIRTCVIATIWPGATAEDVENLITDPLEELIDVLDEVDVIRSESSSGKSVIWVDLLDQVPTTEIDNIWDKISQKMKTAALPDGSQPPVMNRDFGDTSSFLIGLYQTEDSPRRYTARELDLLSGRLKDQLLLLDTVARVDEVGIPDEAIYLETELGTWSQLGINSQTIAELLSARNIVLPGGNIDTEDSRFGVKPSGELDAVKEMEKIITGYGPNGAPVYLKDLGITVSRRYVEPRQREARYISPESKTSRQCIVLSVIMRDGENVVKMGKDITALFRAKSELAEDGYAKTYAADFMPKDVRLSVLSNVPTVVNKAIQGVFISLGQAVLLVVAVAMLLIGLRVALVMAAAIPLVMVSTLGIMTFFNVELETMSVASLIIALGMLVDNAIEVCDNTLNFLKKGMSKFQACVQGVNQIAFPIFIATLTSIFAFVPMLTIPGAMGEYIRSIPLVVSIALAVSYLLAVTMTTMMAYFMMKPGDSMSPLGWVAFHCGKLFRKIMKRPEPDPDAEGLFSKICMGAIRIRLITITLAFIMFFGCISLITGGKVGTAFFPAALRDQFTIKITLPEGSPIEQTNRTVALVEDHVRKIGGDRLFNAVAYVGEGGPRFYLSLEPEMPGSNVGFIQVNCVDPFQVEAYMADLGNSFDKGSEEHGLSPVTGAALSYAKLQKGPPVEYPVSFRLYGQDMASMRATAEKMKAKFRSIEGTWDVSDDWGNLTHQLDINVDQDAANLSGVTNASLAQTLNTYFSGQYLTTYREGSHTIPVYLRLPQNEIESIAGLGSAYVEGRNGKVPLNAVASIEPTWQIGKIARRAQQRCMEVRCRIRGGILGNDVTKALVPMMKEIEETLPAGYRIETAGEQAESADAQGYMGSAFAIAFMLIIMCLVVQFNSFGKVVIILATLPLAWGGGIFGLYVTGHPLGFMSMLGLLSLAGIVINVAIVLIEFIEHQVKEKQAAGIGLAAEGEKSYGGLTISEFRRCVVDGTSHRILPITLTTLTTVGGLLPLALGGDPFWEPLAWVMIFGLLFSAVLALLVIPAMYTLAVERFGVRSIIVPGTEEK